MSAKSWRLIARVAIRLLLSAFVALIALALAVLVVLPKAVHGAALTVLTGSMTPTIPVGSVVLDRPVDPGTLHVGDIATYQKAPGKAEYITHRIIKIDASRSPVMFTFKGDANRGEDIVPVPATAIRGKVWFHVPYLGAIRDTLHTRGGMSGLAMLLLIGYVGVQLAGARRDKTVSDGAVDKDETKVFTRVHVSQSPRSVVMATIPTASFAPLASEVRERVGAGLIIATTDDSVTVLLPDDGLRGGQTSELLRSLKATDVATATFDHNDGEPMSSIDVLRRRVVVSHA